MGKTTIFFVLVAASLLASGTSHARTEDNPDELDFEEDDSSHEQISASLKIEEDAAKNKTDDTQEVTSIIRTKEKRNQISEVVPVIRNTSRPQRRLMGSLISSRISNNVTITPLLEDVEPLLGSNNSRENATRELMLPIDADIAKIITDDTPEELPEAQELRRPGKRRRIYYRPPPRRASSNRRNVYGETSRPSGNRPIRRPADPKRTPTEKECTFFSKTVCLEAVDYPHEFILRSIRSNKEMVAALLADYKVQDSGILDDELPPALQQESRYENRYESNEIKRKYDLSTLENVEEGFTCPSQVKYARPQLARAASGVWKYIINTGEHTQTLRLEKCSNPHTSCSFISENYRSSCVQVYNYHRLLTWDSKLGLHMDIFKVPTCCSCHVHGYTEIYPPHQKDPPPKPKESFPGVDFATEDNNEDLGPYGKPTNYVNKYTHHINYDSSFGAGHGHHDSSPTSYLNDLSEASNVHTTKNKKPVLDATVNRPTYSTSGRVRPKKPAPVPRPYDKLPQQHAPNTRAPGYTGGPLLKAPRPNRPNRPYRRESTSHVEYHGTSRNSTLTDRFSTQFDQGLDGTTRLQSGNFDEEYQEPPRRVNYNYHPIIDFFKPEAAMLQSTQPEAAQTSSEESNSWKPMVSS
ncbi:neurotrophin 1 [Orussus abietinus]|uniref:neurotrophin 1 n=1 Tax=Orussus abietinus TaxID=222816 RepID=UPI000626C932|nr:neurotrophin 1 [Orussus abietinus]